MLLLDLCQGELNWTELKVQTWPLSVLYKHCFICTCFLPTRLTSTVWVSLLAPPFFHLRCSHETNLDEEEKTRKTNRTCLLYWQKHRLTDFKCDHSNTGSSCTQQTPFWYSGLHLHGMIVTTKLIYLPKAALLFSKCWPQTNSISITQEFVRNANSQAWPQTYWIRNSDVGPGNLHFVSSPGDSDVGESLGITCADVTKIGDHNFSHELGWVCLNWP